MASRIPKVCVVIPTWNHKNDLSGVLEEINKSVVDNFVLKTCVVDNGSVDDTSDFVQKEFPGVKLIKNSTNLGFVKACNAGMRWALNEAYDYVALLNDDTKIDKNLIKSILEEHIRNSEAGAISPKIYFAGGYEYHNKYKKSELGKVIWYAGGKIDWKNVYGSNRGVDEVDEGQYDKTEETDFATGCFVMFKAEALRGVGLYDDRYFAYLEDVDHSQRLKKSGWKVQYTSAGFLWHKVSQSSGIGSDMNDYFLTRNRMMFGLKYAGLRTKIALIKESIRLLFNGRRWQRIGIRDYYVGRLGRGSWR